jgi:hypothetical protein
MPSQFTLKEMTKKPDKKLWGILVKELKNLWKKQKNHYLDKFTH